MVTEWQEIIHNSECTIQNVALLTEESILLGIKTFLPDFILEYNQNYSVSILNLSYPGSQNCANLPAWCRINFFVFFMANNHFWIINIFYLMGANPYHISTDTFGFFNSPKPHIPANLFNRWKSTLNFQDGCKTTWNCGILSSESGLYLF